MSDPVVAVDKETREALIAVNEIVLELAKVVKGGSTMADIMILLADLTTESPLKVALANAIDGLSKVSGEVSAMGIPGYADLVQVQLGYLPQILAAFKKA